MTIITFIYAKCFGFVVSTCQVIG